MGQTGAVGRLVAVVMLLLAFGAGVLVPAGGAHQRPAAAADDDVRATSPLSAHEHHHGTDRAPTLNKRLRPVAVLTVVAARPGPGVVSDDGSLFAAPRPVGDVLARLGVLRV